LFLSNRFLKDLFFNNLNKQRVLNTLWLRLDFLIFRFFPVTSLFFVRQIIRHGFVLLNSCKLKGSEIIKPGDVVVITRYLYFPKQIFGKNRFPFLSLLFFDVDINFCSQSFVLNSYFLNSCVRFSAFSGFSFKSDHIKDFYNR